MNTRSSPIRTDIATLGLTRVSVAALAAVTVGLAVFTAGPARSATVDIKNVPLGTATVTAKPNVMFILDDSGSMGWDYMPDELANVNVGECNTDNYACLAAQCNGVAFDPTEDYPLPVRADGTFYPNVSFSAAPNDGFNSGSGTTNLGAANRNGVTPNVYYSYEPQAPRVRQPALNWRYNADGSLISNTFSQECFSSIGSSPGSLVFVRKTVDPVLATDSALRQKYANWWSYYRKRYLLMRSAAGLSFKELDSNFRIGFTVISDQGITGSKFLDVGDFDATQRTTFFTKLYASTPGSGTPLRGALSKVGSYYGKAITGQSFDPAAYTVTNPVTGLTTTSKYQCQRNYAILSTDGYWNRNNQTGNLGSIYLDGFQLDGNSRVGNQDGDAATPRPMHDGASSIRTTVTPITQVNRIQVTTPITRRQTVTRVRFDDRTSNCNAGSGNRSGRIWRKREQHATQTSTLNEAALFDTTYRATRTQRFVNGTEQLPAVTTVLAEVGPRVAVGTPTLQQTGTASTTTFSTDTDTDVCLANANVPAQNPTYQTNINGQVSGTPSDTRGTAGSPFITAPGQPVDGTPTSTDTTTAGDSNSLADIAAYYYKTDLRPDIVDGVKATGRDTATWQHMTTYTIGLGVRGSLDFDPNYLVGEPSGDYGALVNGTKQWPVPTGTVSTNDDYDATHVDDLWHAAVNGRGQYFSASNASTLSNALKSALNDVLAARGTAAAAASSTLTPSATDDWLFLTTYDSSPAWNGDLKAFKFTFDDKGNVVQPNTSLPPKWTVKSKLDSRDIAVNPRTIYFDNDSGRASGVSPRALASFSYGALSATQKGYFDDRCPAAPATGLLAQCGAIAANVAKATGENLVNFINGDQSLLLNDLTPSNQVWRARANRLGDIVHSSPVYVAKPGFKYNDAGYAAFAASRAARTKVVFAGANDGMLHAFKVAETGDATAGEELWACVPNAVIPNLWHLADSNYDENHRYYVDATPNIGDVYDGSAWHTILVGGLGGGGRSYYALDITDPTAPKMLWEFTDNDLGMTFGNPVITKNKAGKWVVAFSSGYNNVNPGDGKGYLYIIDALKGVTATTPMVKLPTNVGNIDTPSNLGRINAWVVKDSDNTALRFYGGDMLGNMWRFDPDNLVPPTGAEATLLGIATTPTGDEQPITGKPVLSEVVTGGGLKLPIVSFGTGRYLGDGDLTDAARQSIYFVKDTLAATGHGPLRGVNANLVQRRLNSSRALIDPLVIDWNFNNGWYVDLTASDRERVYLDGAPIAAGIVGFASTVPNGDPCKAGGESWLYEFDILNGLISQVTHYNSMIVGLGRIVDTGVQGLVTTQDGLGSPPPKTLNPPGSAFIIKRTSWRELQD